MQSFMEKKFDHLMLTPYYHFNCYLDLTLKGKMPIKCQLLSNLTSHNARTLPLGSIKLSIFRSLKSYFPLQD